MAQRSSLPAVTLPQLILGFARRHWRAYAAAGGMLVLIAVLTVWVPRRVGHIVDAFVAGTLAGNALWQELAILLAMGRPAICDPV